MNVPASPIDMLMPTASASPLVFASPHSGAFYPDDFVAASPLELGALRKSEDCYVDELFTEAPAAGAPLLRALYPRAYLDVNREPYELDPEMFGEPLPPFVNTSSPRVAAGLGTIARIVASRREIYRDKLTFSEAERRINGVYKPYHDALRLLVNRARQTFGFCILIDCHSMPSSGLPLDSTGHSRVVDMVLGDRTGLSCHQAVTDAVEDFLRAQGYHSLRNNPYAGGFTTQHYGDPGNGIHALQIEINRNLYMDEMTLQRRGTFTKLRTDVTGLIGHLAGFAAAQAGQLTYQRLSAE